LTPCIMHQPLGAASEIYHILLQSFL